MNKPGSVSPLPTNTLGSDSDPQRRIRRSQDILAGIERKIQRLQHAKAERSRALAELNAANFRGLDHEHTALPTC